MTRVSQVQMKKLLDLLSEDGVMVLGKVMYTDTNRHSFWKKVAAQLNSIEGGAFKNAYKWCKMWADWKNKTKKKADVLLKKKKCEFMPQPLTLTNLELRLLQVICYPMDDNAESQWSHEMIHKIEIPESIKTDMHIDFVAEQSNDSQLNGKFESDDEDNKALKYFSRDKRKLACSEDIMGGNAEIFEDFLDKRMKTEDNVKRPPSCSFEEFKVRTKLTLEKEKSHQKSEELRLRAIELKLKGEELKLKEAEMNKVNYLTNLEEEKLKCLREISSSLKELLERNRSGSLRFNM